MPVPCFPEYRMRLLLQVIEECLDPADIIVATAEIGTFYDGILERDGRFNPLDQELIKGTLSTGDRDFTGGPGND